MAKEEKTLLLQDICARLPYGVILYDEHCKKDYKLISLDVNCFINYDIANSINHIKPYLRPLSSMNMDEINEYENFITNEKDSQIRFCNELIFYNSHHFDYRGLIEKGLALEAPEGMYGENC